MITIVINGQNYDYPQVGDTEWGDAATTAMQALATTTLQPVKDLNDPTAVNNFTLYNDINFGNTNGLRVLFVESNSNNPALNGVFRLCNGELVAWRNGNNDNDNSISFDASDNFVINGNTISFDVNGEMLVNGVQVTRSGEIVNADVADSAGIVESKLALDYSTQSLYDNIENHKADTNNPHSVTKSQVLTGDLIVNSDVDSSAGIEESKLALDYSTSTLNTNIGNVSSDLTTHTSNTSNPHSVTKSQVLTGDLIVNNDVDASAAIVESKLALDYATSTLNTNIGNVSSDLTTHTSDTSNPHSTSIDNLNDTTIDSNTLAVDDVLVYNDQTAKWENSQVMINHIGSAANPHLTTVGKLTDVNIDNNTLANGDILTYDSQNLIWKNTANSGGGGGDSRFANVAGAYVTDFKRYLGVSKAPCIVKAGSYIRLTFHKDDIVITPNGVETTLTNDVFLDITNLSTTDEFFIFYSPSNNELLYATRSNMVEKNSEPAFSTNTIWLNTNYYGTYDIKAGKGATSWSDTVYTDLSVPLCIIKNQKIVELFDYFGSYFLLYYFIYPSTKYLRPLGRNADGTFNNSEVLINSGSIYRGSASPYYKGNKYPAIGLNNGAYSNIADKIYKFVYVDDEIPAGYNVGVYQNSMYGFQYLFSYLYNRWFTMSSGTPQVNNSIDMIVYLTLEGTNGNIIKMDKPPVLMNKNKLLDTRKIKNEDTYYATTYPMDKTPESSNIILTVNDNRNNIIYSSSGYNIVLPCVGIKQGDKFSFTFVSNPSSNVTVQSFTRATITTITTSGGNSEYCFVAKCDLPGGSGDWFGYKKSITTL